MKKLAIVLAGSFCLGLAVTGCVAVESPPEVPSTGASGVQNSSAPASSAPASSAPAPVPSNDAVVPSAKPYSANGLEARIEQMSEKSDARQLRAGKHPIDDAVPGSEKVLVADAFTGEQRVALPESTDGDRLMVSLLCQEKTTFTLDVYGEPNDAYIQSVEGQCDANGGFGISIRSNDHLAPSNLHVVPDGDSTIELTVLSYEPTDTSD